DLAVQAYGKHHPGLADLVKNCSKVLKDWKAVEDRKKKSEFAEGLDELAALEKLMASLRRQKAVLDGYKDFPGKPEVTPQDVLAEIAAGKEGRLQAATQAFQAQQENLLLRAWEYTTATLAQVDDAGKELKDGMKGDFNRWVGDLIAKVQKDE